MSANKFVMALTFDKQEGKFSQPSPICFKARSHQFGFHSGQLHFRREIGNFLLCVKHSLLRKTQIVAASVNQPLGSFKSNQLFAFRVSIKKWLVTLVPAASTAAGKGVSN